MEPGFFASLGNSRLNGRRSSVVAPIIYLTGVVLSILAFLYIRTTNENHKTIFLIVGGLIILYDFTIINYLLFKDRNALRSEHFNLENKKLDIVAQMSNTDNKKIEFKVGETVQIIGKVNE